MATKAQQERIAKWVSRWKSRLLLDNWAIIIRYEEKDSEINRTDGALCDDFARIVIDRRYKEASLRIYPATLKAPLGFQKATILHEIIHIITWPLKEALERSCRKGAITVRERDDLFEGITEDITKIVLREGKPGKDNYRL